MLGSSEQKRLIIGMANKKAAQELATLADSAAPMSAKTKRVLEVALASKKSAKEVIDAVEAGGGSLSDEAKARIRLMMNSKDAADALITEIET